MLGDDADSEWVMIIAIYGQNENDELLMMATHG